MKLITAILSILLLVGCMEDLPKKEKLELAKFRGEPITGTNIVTNLPGYYLTMNADGTNTVYGLQRSWSHTFNGSKFSILNNLAPEITVSPNARVEILCTNEVESITYKGKVIWKKEDIK